MAQARFQRRRFQGFLLFEANGTKLNMLTRMTSVIRFGSWKIWIYFQVSSCFCIFVGNRNFDVTVTCKTSQHWTLTRHITNFPCCLERKRSHLPGKRSHLLVSHRFLWSFVYFCGATKNHGGIVPFKGTSWYLTVAYIVLEHWNLINRWI